MFQPLLRKALAIAILTLVLSVQTRADWINLTGAETAPNIAEIYILDDRVRLVLEAYVGDLEVFDELVPDDWLADKIDARPPLDERMRTFAEHKFQVVTDSGEKLPARFERVEPRLRVDRQSPFAGMINPFTRSRVPDAPADKRVLYAEISYPFEGRPSALTFVPPLDEEGRARVSVGFIAYHKSVPIIDFRYLGTAARVELDWDDPWYSRFDNPNLKRHHKDALMSYLYVEPYEVRHEILTRVRDMANWMDLGLRGEEFIEIDELEPLKQRIGEFLLGRNPVLVDGQALPPILDRSNYVKVGITGIQLLEVPERLEISTAIVGVILTYLTDGMPQQVSVDWDLFTDQIERVPATAIDPAGPLLTYVDPDDRIHTWTNFLKNYQIPGVVQVSLSDTVKPLRIPLATLICFGLLLPLGAVIALRKRRGRSNRLPWAGAAALAVAGLAFYPVAGVSVHRPMALVGSLSEEEAKGILDSLLRNVYRAFDFRGEDQVYDKLALSVDGALLEEVYLQNRRSLAVQRAGGAQAKIKEVEVRSAAAESLADGGGFRVLADWTASGSVGHWGHVHLRENAYQALIDIAPVDGHWRINRLELLEERRIDPAAQASPAG
jgi:hypothetical protein